MTTDQSTSLSPFPTQDCGEEQNKLLGRTKIVLASSNEEWICFWEEKLRQNGYHFERETIRIASENDPQQEDLPLLRLRVAKEDSTATIEFISKTLENLTKNLIVPEAIIRRAQGGEIAQVGL